MDAVKPIPMYEALDKHGAPYMRLAKFSSAPMKKPSQQNC